MDKPERINWLVEFIRFLMWLFLGWLGISGVAISIRALVTAMDVGQSHSMWSSFVFLSALSGMVGFMLVVVSGFAMIRGLTALGQRHAGAEQIVKADIVSND